MDAYNGVTTYIFAALEKAAKVIKSYFKKPKNFREIH